MPKKNNRQKSTKEQIRELTDQLTQITLQLTRLKHQVQQEREQAVAEGIASSNNRSRGLQIGDTVCTNNNYQYLQGSRGTVIKRNTSFVTIRLNNGSQVVRRIHNVEIISRPQRWVRTKTPSKATRSRVTSIRKSITKAITTTALRRNTKANH